MAECIHGFDEGLCDICFPRSAPEPPPTVAATATRTARSATGTATAPRRPRASAPTRTAAPPGPAFGTRRLYHVTHLRNLESILLDGAIVAIGAGAEPDVDVTAPLVRELRGARDVGDGRTAADFVPFALAPDGTRWTELRDGGEGPHWSDAARRTAPTQYVMLVVEAKRLGSDVVVADGDASAPATSLTVGDPGRAVARATREGRDLGAVEVLVPERVPLSDVVLLGVPNEPMRNRVRALFDAVDGTPPKIVVHPPWFTPTGS